MRPPVGIIIPFSRLLIFFNGGSFPTRHVEVVRVIFLEKRRYGQKGLLYLIMTVLLYNDDVHRLAVFSILLVSSIHGKGNRSQISFDDLWKLLTKYFFWFYVRFFQRRESQNICTILRSSNTSLISGLAEVAIYYHDIDSDVLNTGMCDLITKVVLSLHIYVICYNFEMEHSELITTGECGDRTEPGIFYDGNDLAWRNGVRI